LYELENNNNYESEVAKAYASLKIWWEKGCQGLGKSQNSWRKGCQGLGKYWNV